MNTLPPWTCFDTTTGGRVGNDDSCQYANDSACDEPAYCVDGTDCTDCRTCGNDDSCQYANDSECDEPAYCVDGTDCTDCRTCGDPVDRATCEAIGGLEQDTCEAVLTDVDSDGDTRACTFSRTVNFPATDAAGSATCQEIVGLGWGGTQVQLSDAESLAECAALVMSEEPGANGVEYCPAPGQATNQATEETMTCSPGSCFARRTMQGITGWRRQYRSCFLDKACQKCEAGKHTVQTYEFETGDGLGGTEVQLADQANAAACAALVQSTHPHANGATFAGQLCYAECVRAFQSSGALSPSPCAPFLSPFRALVSQTERLLEIKTSPAQVWHARGADHFNSILFCDVHA